MQAGPSLRVNGATLEVIKDGQVITRYPLGDRDFHVRIAGGSVELTADGRVIDRYPINDLSSTAEESMTRIPVREAEPADHADVMFY